MASISSMKIMLGAHSSALSNSYRTRDAPKPENFWTNSLPEREKKFTFVSPAQALASKVFPVPGGPVRRIPLGTFAPISLYLELSFRKCINSVTSIFASCIPATSLNRMFILSGVIGAKVPEVFGFLALMLLKEKFSPLPTLIFKSRKPKITKLTLFNWLKSTDVEAV